MNVKADPSGPGSRSAADTVRRSGHRSGRRSGLGFVKLFSVVVVVAVGGFIWFVAQVRSEEQRPSRKADGIVVLTGGSSRIADAVDLLAEGYGKRLLISGVHPANGTHDISRSLPDTDALLSCCVDLDRSAVNTRSNATETRRWMTERGFHSLIVVTSNYHMPRAMVELSHAMPDMDLIFYPVIGDKWHDEPWWQSGAALRLLLSEYAKYVAAEVRVRLADLGFDPFPENLDQPASEANSRPTASAN